MPSAGAIIGHMVVAPLLSKEQRPYSQRYAAKYRKPVADCNHIREFQLAKRDIGEIELALLRRKAISTMTQASVAGTALGSLLRAD